MDSLARPGAAPALCFLSAFLAAPALATDWVVDDDGGPGVDFTTLEDAVAAAGAGDVILLREGDYTPPGFFLELSAGVTLRADPPGADVDVDVQLVVRDLPPGAVARVRGFELSALSAQDCAGTVRVDDMRLGWLEARGSANVRVADTQVLGWLACPFSYPCVESAAVVRDSYVEFVRCRLEGDSDFEGNHGYDGSHGLHVEPGGVARFADSVAIAGFGGDSGCFFPQAAGDGGDGILVEAGGRALIEGSLGPVPALGNIAGFGCSAMYDGQNGVDLRVHGFAQLFDVTLADFASVDVAAGAVVEEEVAVARLTGVVGAAALDLDVRGPAGAPVTLIYGRRHAFELLPAVDEPLLLDPVRLDAVGALDGAGTLHHVVPLPAGVAPGTRFVAQAMVVDAGGRRLSNALLLQVP